MSAVAQRLSCPVAGPAPGSQRAVRSRLLPWGAAWTVAGMLACLAVGPAQALMPDLRLSQLHHSAWLVRDGAPTDIHAIRQTSDGYLWLGTDGGLVRFDGTEFERVDLFPSGGGPGMAQNVASLMVDREGALWVGFRLAGVMKLVGGRRQRWYDWNSGLPIGTVQSLLQDPDGQIWAATSRGLYMLQGERWAAAGQDAGMEPGMVEQVLLDAQGTLWAQRAGGKWFARSKGTTGFEHRPSMDGVSDAALGRDGQLWLLDRQGQVRLQGEARLTAPPTGLKAGFATLLADRDGGLWVIHNGTGLRRLARPSRPGSPGTVRWEVMDSTQGLSGDRVTTAYQDRQGHLWVGTTAGLDHFRPARAVLVPFADGPNAGVMVADGDGSLAAASITQPPTRLRPFGPPEVLPGDYRPQENIFGAAFRDTDGSIWFGGAPDLWHQTNGRLRRMPAPADVPPGRPMQAISRDARGQLWAAWVPGPLRRFTGSGWAEPDPAERGEIVMVLHNDAQGGFWRGLASGEVVRRDAQGEQRWGREQGLALGMVLCILSHQERVWVGGEQGLALRIGTRFVPLRVQGEQPLRTVSGILAAPDGALWLNEESGILRIGPAALRAWLARPGEPVSVSRLDWRDGVLGSSPQFRLLPSAVAATDGRFWFSRGQGIYWVDPAEPAAQPAPPPVLFTGLWADAQRFDPAAPKGLPVRPRSLRIRYAAPLPGAALQLRYQVRLNGLDDRWQEVGPRRELVYNQLPPGDYTLEVQALLGENGRSESRSLSFTVPPAYYQTGWFRALMALGAVVVVVSLYRWRVAANCRRVQERIEARLAERERIARELHDTLLQGTQALSMQIEADLQALPPDDPRRQTLGRALGQADAAVAEARDRVQDLRRHQEPAELSRALGEAIDLLRPQGPGGPRVLAQHQGRPRTLVNAIWHEAFRLGLEAAQNALQHARARVISVRVDYGADALTLTVEDDGVGLPVAGDATEAQADSVATPGHYGLRGLQERARQMGGTLEIASQPGRGTRVKLRVRAAGAYAASGWRGRWRTARGPADAGADTA